MLVSDVLAEVRRVTNDNDSVAYRYDDDAMLVFVNSALRRIASVRPDLFTTIGNITCTADSVLQSSPNLGRVVEVFQVVDGDAVTEATREAMDQNYPGWRSAAAGPAVNWMRHNRNPSKFWIYPKAPNGQELLAEWHIAPTEMALVGDTVPLFDGYLSILADMTVAVVEWSDDEHMLTQRAETFYRRALQALGVTMQTQPATDLEESGQDVAKVI